jgi:hypothetical protein
MELFAGPASLGGLIMGVAVCAWGLGRWQALGHHRLADDARAPLPDAEGEAQSRPAPNASPYRQNVRDERHEAIGQAVSLAELHEEISAFRQREQVLACYAPDTLRLERLPQPSPAAPPLTRV